MTDAVGICTAVIWGVMTHKEIAIKTEKVIQANKTKGSLGCVPREFLIKGMVFGFPEFQPDMAVMPLYRF